MILPVLLVIVGLFFFASGSSKESDARKSLRYCFHTDDPTDILDLNYTRCLLDNYHVATDIELAHKQAVNGKIALGAGLIAGTGILVWKRKSRVESPVVPVMHD